VGEFLPKAAQFVTTHWSVVLAAGDAGSPRAQEALEQLCRTYWYPLYAFVRREGFGPEEAQDLTQSFFAQVLERRDFASARREKGRLRSFLLVALKHFLVDEWRRMRAEKRGKGQTLIPLDEILAEERYNQEPVDSFNPDKIYERRWALTVLDRVLKALGEEYEAAGNRRLFEQLKTLLSDEPGRPSQAELALKLTMTENALKQAFHRLRRRYRELLKLEIASTVAAPGEVEEELRCLVRALRG
jgi:RNA polymerase sigma-70 factor (ECF subfamily)